MTYGDYPACDVCGIYVGNTYRLPLEVSQYARSRGYEDYWEICPDCRERGVSLFYWEDGSEFVYYCGLPIPGYTNACPRHE